MRSAVAHARIRAIHVPSDHKDAVFTAEHLAGVNPIRAATALRGFKHSAEPILAVGKVRYVGEIVAMCVGGSRAQAEDIAALVTVDYDELPAVSDMLAARRSDAALVHEEWGDNVFIELFEDGPVERAAATAAIKVTREIRRALHAADEGGSSPIGTAPRFAPISASQMPHVVQRASPDARSTARSGIRLTSAAASATRVCSAARRRWRGWRGAPATTSAGRGLSLHLTANANCRGITIASPDMPTATAAAG